MDMPLHRQAPSGFSLIELITVVAIILVLVGLILGAGVPMIREQAQRRLTTQRIENVAAGVQVYLASDPRAGDAVTEALLGYPLRLATLREVLSALSAYGLDYTTATGTNAAKIGTRPPSGFNVGWWGANRNPGTGTLPPGLATRAELLTRFNPNSSASILVDSVWQLPGSGLNYHIAFLDRQLGISARRGDALLSSTVGKVADIYGMVGPGGNNGKGYGSDPGETGQGTSFWTPRDYRASPIGETLERTLEVVPSGIWKTQDYYDAWPGLTETTATAGTTVEVTQTSWPLAARLAADQRLPAIWPWPWGERKISRQMTTLIEDVQEGKLRDLSPLSTLFLLSTSGVLPSGAAGELDYRSDRGTSRPWNDAWGRPIIIAAALWHAPRYDFDPAVRIPYGNPVTGATSERPEISRDLAGGRDFFVQKAKEYWGAYRGFYIAGAVAPTVPADPWPASDDRSVLLGIWDEACTRTGAGDAWDENAWVNPPFNGYAVDGKGKDSAIVTAPRPMK